MDKKKNVCGSTSGRYWTHRWVDEWDAIVTDVGRAQYYPYQNESSLQVVQWASSSAAIGAKIANPEKRGHPFVGDAKWPTKS